MRCRSLKFRVIQAVLWFLLFMLMAFIMPDGPPAQSLDLTAGVSQAAVISRWGE